MITSVTIALPFSDTTNEIALLGSALQSQTAWSWVSPCSAPVCHAPQWTNIPAVLQRVQRLAIHMTFWDVLFPHNVARQERWALVCSPRSWVFSALRALRKFFLEDDPQCNSLFPYFALVEIYTLKECINWWVSSEAAPWTLHSVLGLSTQKGYWGVWSTIPVRSSWGSWGCLIRG